MMIWKTKEKNEINVEKHLIKIWKFLHQLYQQNDQQKRNEQNYAGYKEEDKSAVRILHLLWETQWHLKSTNYDYTAQKLKFSIFFSKCDQIRNFLQIWWHFLKKSSMENFILCAVLSIKRRRVKVRSFLGVTIADMYGYIKPFLKKASDNAILLIRMKR